MHHAKAPAPNSVGALPASDRHRPTRHLWGLFAFAFPLAVYLLTLAPTIFPGDAAELTAAAWCLGVAHPTGYPLYMVLGWVATHFGPGSPAANMNGLCALFGALAALATYRLALEVWRLALGGRAAREWPCRAAAATTAAALALSATWWDFSTTADVHSLTMAFVAFAWATGLRLIRRPTRRGLWALAFLSGAAFLNHQVFLVTLPLSALGLAFWWRQGEPGQVGRGRTVALACLLFALPLADYAYLPLRAAARPAINSGDPRGLTGLLAHLTGKQFRTTRVLTEPTGQRIAAGDVPAHVAVRCSEILVWMGEQWKTPDRKVPPGMASGRPSRSRGQGPAAAMGFILLALAALGLPRLFGRSPWAAAGLVGGGLLNLLVVIVYTIADIEPYQVPLLLLVVVLAAVAPAAAGEYFFDPSARNAAVRDRSRRMRILGAAAVALVLAGAAAAQWRSPGRKAIVTLAERSHDYAVQLLETVPPNAVVFTSGDYDIYPLWYAQVCEGLRPDVAVVGSNFVFSRWYAAMLRADLPPGVEVFIGDEPPSTSDRWLVAFLGGCVAPQIEAGRPVFLTLYSEAPERTMIGSHYKLTPACPAFASPTPFLDGPDYTLYRLEDPNGFSVQATQMFRSPEFFPHWRDYLVHRE